MTLLARCSQFPDLTCATNLTQLVYNRAIAAIPDSLTFRQGFLELLGQFKLKGVPGLRQNVLDSIRAHLGDREECWDVQARADAVGCQSAVRALEKVSDKLQMRDL